MSQFDCVFEHAIGNYGLITTAEAGAMGVARKDILEWVKLGRLVRLGRGVYRISRYIPTEYDRYAEAIALVGGDSMLWGESVLAMHNLALVNPLYVYVASTKRIRKELPDWLKVVNVPVDFKRDVFHGIPCQNLASVFRDAKGKILTDRIVTAIKEAAMRGLLRQRELVWLNKEFSI